MNVLHVWPPRPEGRTARIYFWIVLFAMANPELDELPTDSLGSPEPVVASHLPDEREPSRPAVRGSRLLALDRRLQSRRKPSRCQRRSVSGFTTSMAPAHRFVRLASTTRVTRSRGLRRARPTRRRKRRSCCRSSRFSARISSRDASESARTPRRNPPTGRVARRARRSRARTIRTTTSSTRVSDPIAHTSRSRAGRVLSKLVRPCAVSYDLAACSRRTNESASTGGTRARPSCSAVAGSQLSAVTRACVVSEPAAKDRQDYESQERMLRIPPITTVASGR